MTEVHSIGRVNTNGVGENEKILNAEPWTCRLFCGECQQPWTGRAPCTHCGRFSQPRVLNCRQVLVGVAWMPWTWERRYQFLDEEAKAAQEKDAEREEERMSRPRAMSAG